MNADEIARGLSPFNSDSTMVQSGRLMLDRMNGLLTKGGDFAFETTLSTKSFRSFVLKAKEQGYRVSLLFFWLNHPDLAVKRVEIRVKEGGHHIPENVIRRRYENGLNNFFKVFYDQVDEWMFIDNSGDPYEVIAEKDDGFLKVKNEHKWLSLIAKYKNQTSEG